MRRVLSTCGRKYVTAALVDQGGQDKKNIPLPSVQEVALKREQGTKRKGKGMIISSSPFGGMNLELQLLCLEEIFTH